MAVGYHRPYRLASAPPLTRHSLVALGLISRLGGLDHGIVQGHRGAVAEAEPLDEPPGRRPGARGLTGVP